MSTAKDIFDAIIDSDNVNLLDIVKNGLYDHANQKLDEYKKEVGGRLFNESDYKYYGSADPEENAKRKAAGDHNSELDKMHKEAGDAVRARGGSIITDRERKQDELADRNAKIDKQTPNDRSNNAKKIQTRLNKITPVDNDSYANSRMNKLNGATNDFNRSQEQRGQQSSTKLQSRNMQDPLKYAQETRNSKRSSSGL